MASSENKFGLVIMASGLSKRFGRNKLIEELSGKPVIKWIIDTTEGLFDKRVVVTRSEAVRKLCEELDIECIFHELPNRNDTVRLGLEKIMSLTHYCFFTPADQPLISRETIIKLLNEAGKSSNSIIRTRFDNVVGAPIGFPKDLYNELLSLPEGKGGGYIARNRSSEVIYIDVSKEYELLDIDTEIDLEYVKNILKNYTI